MEKLNLSHLSVREFVELLLKSGTSSASMESVKRLLESGAPSNPDGTIDLVLFSAWMIREYQKKND